MSSNHGFARMRHWQRALANSWAAAIRYRSRWCWLDQLFDASILSDEAIAPGLPNITGAFVGLAA